MQDSGDSKLSTEPFWVSCEIDEGARTGLEEKIEDGLTIAHGQRSELPWQGEDAMEVVSGQGALFSFFDPFGLREALAFRAVTIAAGVV